MAIAACGHGLQRSSFRRGVGCPISRIRHWSLLSDVMYNFVLWGEKYVQNGIFVLEYEDGPLNSVLLSFIHYGVWKWRIWDLILG